MIFKQFLFSSAVVAALALSSCSEAEEKQTTATEQAEEDAILTNVSPATPGASSAQSATVVSSPAGLSQSSIPGSTQAAKTAANVNPPHGQPGHDCAVAVGAPLNGPVATTTITTPPPGQQPAPATPASTPAGSGARRMNPPHGQPGHDCAVAVGAPLK